MTVLEIVSIWENSKIKTNKGADISEIIELEKYLDFKFPNAFIEFYTNMNGFKDDDWNEHMFSIFPIERIKEEYGDSKDEKFIPFCDYLINSHQIGFSKDVNGIYIDYDTILGSENDKVSDTFELSLIEILNNTDKIY